MTGLPPSAPLIQQAMQCMQAGDPGGAEKVLNRLLATYPADANGLHLMGLVRMRQERHGDAAALIRRSIALSPNYALTHLNLGKVCVLLGEDENAVVAFHKANQLKTGLGEAHFELGNALCRLSRLPEARDAYTALLELQPDHMQARLALGSVLLDLQCHAEAETLYLQTIAFTHDQDVLAQLWNNLVLARRGLGDNAGAVAACLQAQQQFPQFVHLDALRADALDALQRHDEALATLDTILARDPVNLAAHMHYNSLLYRLGREDFMASFDRAPQTLQIRAAKAARLIQHVRPAEAHEIYAGLAAENPDALEYQVGLGVSGSMMRQFEPAVRALEKAISISPQDAHLYAHLANTLICSRDPQKAAAMAELGRALAPADQSCLALLGTAWRMMGDARDETLNGYDHLIRIFDLEPPKGFSDMESFNAELSGYLDGLHPNTREFLEQSLRNGTQTLNHLFGQGHELVERVRTRIDEALNRYIRETRLPADHPFNRGLAARMAGSWSSRLRDCGYHANHIHPTGWISSCYYVAVPDAVKDETEKQGWIKFGEPSFDAGLAQPIRRTIQPRPGRLVFFPSYMWHGTIPFRSQVARTTIAFDAVPA